jgi:N-acetylmuramoyl-L-alanine amidase
MQILQSFIPTGHPNRCGQKMSPIAVVIHYTANDAPSATDTANVHYAGRAYKKSGSKFFEADGSTPFRYGSAHWYIDHDSATQAIPTDEVAWGCGDRQLPYNNGCKGQTPLARDFFKYRQNYMTINYEICNNCDWEAACANAIEVIAKDMVKYNIDPARIYRHHDLTGKNCPAPFVSDEKAWADFRNKLVARVNSLKHPSPTPTPAPVKPTGTTLKVIAPSGVNVRKSPNITASVITAWPCGHQFVGLSLANGWWKVAEGQYVSSSFVKKI